MTNGESPGDTPAQAAAVFGLSLPLATAVLRLRWRHAVRERLVRPDAGDRGIQLLTGHLNPGLAAYLILIVSGLFVTVIAVGGYLAIAVYFIVPHRHGGIVRLRRRRRGRRQEPAAR